MTTELTLSDSQAQTLERLLALAEDATNPRDAVYLDEASAERVSDLKQTVVEQTADAQAQEVPA